jgi:hypothetical protein
LARRGEPIYRFRVVQLSFVRRRGILHSAENLVEGDLDVSRIVSKLLALCLSLSDCLQTLPLHPEHRVPHRCVKRILPQTADDNSSQILNHLETIVYPFHSTPYFIVTSRKEYTLIPRIRKQGANPSDYGLHNSRTMYSAGGLLRGLHTP